MGDAVALRRVPQAQFDNLWSLACDPRQRAALFADLCRLNALYMIMGAGSGHIGSSFSSLDIVSWVHLELLGMRPGGRSETPAVYMSSKGHDAPGLYAVLAGCGQIEYELLDRLRRLGGLPGHPDVGTPGVVANTGSLGMGISKAKGMVEAARATGQRLSVFVLTGDGELQEGQIWESLQSASNRGMNEITVIVDHNKIQSDTWVRDVSDLGDLDAKFAAFGWSVARCDGHDVAAVDDALTTVRQGGRPGVVVADTVKGKGVSFMEKMGDDGLYHFHSGAPSVEVFNRAFDEILARCNAGLVAVGGSPFEPEMIDVPSRPPVTGQRLVETYSRALVEEAERDERIVALDADLVLDTGLIPFARRFPHRFIECGIAEQDMVSQAGGLALRGLLPVVHSFACFLSSRPAEQVYTNATERTKIVYVGSLAGVVPGGPGHSHQAVRDLSLFGGVPGLVAVEPSCQDEVAPLLRLCLHGLPESVYFRLVTIPVDTPFDLPTDYAPAIGIGATIRPGRDGVVFGYGPVLLTEAFDAAEALARDEGLEIEVVALPWLNYVDADWLSRTVVHMPLVVTLDNHYLRGGQGEMLLSTLAANAVPVERVLQRGLTSIPACGSNREVLEFHRLDADSLASDVRARLEAPA